MYRYIFIISIFFSCSSNEKGAAQPKQTNEDPSLFTKTLIEFSQKNDFPGLREFALLKGFQVIDSSEERHMDNKGVNWKSIDTATNNSLVCFLDDSGLAVLDFETNDESFSGAMKDYLRSLGFKYSRKETKGESLELFEQERTVIEIQKQKTGERQKTVFSFMQFE